MYVHNTITATPNTHRLPRSSLCARHEVTALGHNGDGKLLHRGRPNIVALTNVTQCRFKEVAVFERLDVAWRVSACNFDRNFIILVKV